MATILQLPGFRPARQRYGLTLTQAASALGVTPSVLDKWERGSEAGITPGQALRAYDTYVINTESLRTSGKNVLFGYFPMRVARDILSLEIDEIAREFGYSPSYWRKIEANARTAPELVVEELEARIKDTMTTLCAFV